MICEYPMYVNILENGEIKKVLYKDLIKHEKSIIEDNVCYGLIKSNIYSKKDINDYERTAYKELKDLKKAIYDNANVVLVQDSTTERYKVYNG